MKGLKRIVLGALFTVFTATTVASSGLTGQAAPDFVLKSSTGRKPSTQRTSWRRRHDQFLGDMVWTMPSGNAAAR